jgi:opacity protein-like surface antigen
VSIFLRIVPVFFALSICGSMNGQNSDGAPVSELQRRFLQMEQRALDLSKRLSEISGTEPIELIDRNESLAPVQLETDAQKSYDQLPGPMVEPLSIPEEPITEEVPTVYQSEVVRVAPTTQQRKGDYYFMPIIGFSFTSITNYNFDYSGSSLEDDLDGSWGNSIGICAGRRWDNWVATINTSYQFQEYENNYFRNATANRIDAKGYEESFSIFISGGYSVPITNSLSHNGTLGGGIAYRKNTFDATAITPTGTVVPLDPRHDSSVVFTYNFSMGLEYMFSQNYSARLGYRLLGLTSNESFDGSFQHLIELGVGANF